MSMASLWGWHQSSAPKAPRLLYPRRADLGWPGTGSQGLGRGKGLQAFQLLGKLASLAWLWRLFACRSLLRLGCRPLLARLLARRSPCPQGRCCPAPSLYALEGSWSRSCQGGWWRAKKPRPLKVQTLGGSSSRRPLPHNTLRVSGLGSGRCSGAALVPERGGLPHPPAAAPVLRDLLSWRGRGLVTSVRQWPGTMGCCAVAWGCLQASLGQRSRGRGLCPWDAQRIG